jgi:hypothetical protein
MEHCDPPGATAYVNIPGTVISIKDSKGKHISATTEKNAQTEMKEVTILTTGQYRITSFL